jgi:hypothetical protein
MAVDKNAYKYKTLEQKLNFSSNRDMTIKDVMDEQPTFIIWALSTVKGFKLMGDVKKYWIERGGKI